MKKISGRKKCGFLTPEVQGLNLTLRIIYSLICSKKNYCHEKGSHQKLYQGLYETVRLSISEVHILNQSIQKKSSAGASNGPLLLDGVSSIPIWNILEY